MRKGVCNGLQFCLVLAAFSVTGAVVPCPHGLPPEGSRVQENRLKTDQPLYWLDLGAAKYGFKPGHHYSLNILASDPLKPFSDMVLTVQPENGSPCGVGLFHVNTSDLYQPQHCPGVLITNKKQPMEMLPYFLWQAPGCGCVTVRATVIRNGAMYYRDKTTTFGDLSRRLCPKYSTEMSTTVSAKRVSYTMNINRGSSRQNQSLSSFNQTTIAAQKTSRGEGISVLCDLVVMYDGAEVLRKLVFLRRRGLGLLDLTNIQLIKMELAISQRHNDVRECCALQNMDARQECVADIRRRRIDQFCGDGYPNVPFSLEGEKFMRQKEELCCWRLGESRYNCFSETRGGTDELSAYPADGALDESHPVNDIADFLPHIAQSTTMIRTTVSTPRQKKPATTTPHLTTAFIKRVVSTEGDVDRTYSRKHDEIANTRKLKSRRQSDHLESRPALPGTSKDAATQTGVRDFIEVVEEKAAVLTGKTCFQSDSLDLCSCLQQNKTGKYTADLLKERAWRLELSLKCCVEGLQKGKYLHDNFARIWSTCSIHGNTFKSTLKRGRKICQQKYMKCCLEAAFRSNQNRQSPKVEDALMNPTTISTNKNVTTNLTTLPSSTVSQPSRRLSSTTPKTITNSPLVESTKKSSVDINTNSTTIYSNVFAKNHHHILHQSGKDNNSDDDDDDNDDNDDDDDDDDDDDNDDDDNDDDDDENDDNDDDDDDYNDDLNRDIKDITYKKNGIISIHSEGIDTNKRDNSDKSNLKTKDHKWIENKEIQKQYVSSSLKLRQRTKQKSESPHIKATQLSKSRSSEDRKNKNKKAHSKQRRKEKRKKRKRKKKSKGRHVGKHGRRLDTTL